MIKFKNVTIKNCNKETILNNYTGSLKLNSVIYASSNSSKDYILKAIAGKHKVFAGEIIIETKFITNEHLRRNNSVAKLFTLVPLSYPSIIKEIRAKDLLNFHKHDSYALLDEIGVRYKSKIRDLNNIQKLRLLSELKPNSIVLFEDPYIYLDDEEMIMFNDFLNNFTQKREVILTSRRHISDLSSFLNVTKLDNKHLCELKKKGENLCRM